MKDNASLEILLRIINQCYELEKKLATSPEAKSLNRNLKRIKTGFEELGLFMEVPIGESYDETRTDCEASIAGEGVENLFIREVIKPIIYQERDGIKQIVQRGVVIAEAN